MFRLTEDTVDAILPFVLAVRLPRALVELAVEDHLPIACEYSLAIDRKHCHLEEKSR